MAPQLAWLDGAQFGSRLLAQPIRTSQPFPGSAGNPQINLKPSKKENGMFAFRPKLFPEQPKTWFGGTHSPLKSNLGAPWRTQMRPRGAQERPRDAQKTPRSARETPKSSREPTKSIQKAAKMRPRCSRPPQNLPWYAPRCILGAFFAGTCVRKARGSDFRWIFVHRVKA